MSDIPHLRQIIFSLILLLPISGHAEDPPANPSRRTAGPLRVSSNSRYFADANGRIVYLTGSHTWDNLLDRGQKPPFDYAGYLRLLQSHNHNFMRLWTREQSAPSTAKPELDSYPHVYQRTGPGMALDGKPKFDLTKFDPVYFKRLRSRIEAANEQGIYVMVMLFHGFSIERKHSKRENPWPGHPFNSDNNINRINGDANGNGEGEELHTLKVSAITRLQEAYIQKVIDTVNDLGVLYEIANESHRESVEWQYHMIRFIHEYEKKKPIQNPVVMTAMWNGESDKGIDNAALFASPAEAIAPGPGRNGEYLSDPPPADGRKIVISDTDHLWGVGGSPDWAWKSFLRGLNPIFMDPIEDPKWDAVRKALGRTAAVANRINLAKMFPKGALSSTGYCLADPGTEYLVYLPQDSNGVEAGLNSWIKSLPILWRFSGVSERVTKFLKLSVEVDLSQASGPLDVTWFNPSSGDFNAGGKIAGGRKATFTAPFAGPAVLHLASTTHQQLH